MHLVLLGCPGAGKGTQAQLMKKRYDIAQISTGDMLRTSVTTGTPLGKQIKHIMDEGGLVSDDIMIQLVKERIQQPDCTNGFLLDGFPRTIPQAEALRENQINLHYLIMIDVPDAELVKRLSGRRIHPPSGRVYHLIFHPPAIDGKDDITGEPLIHRSDDHEETIRKRLAIYHQQTEPLINYYVQARQKHSGNTPIYIKIDGIGTVDEVSKRIFDAIAATKNSQPS